MRIDTNPPTYETIISDTSTIMKIVKWIAGLFKPKSKVAPENKATANTIQPKEPIGQEVLDNGKFKVGDKVLITCKRKRRDNYLYNGKVGEILHIWDLDLERNPWGNYVVILPNMMQNCFLAEELEVVESN